MARKGTGNAIAESAATVGGAGSQALANPAAASEQAADSRPVSLGTRQSEAPARSGGLRWIWVGGYVAAGLILFLCYLRMSGAASVTSDGGNNVRQAWDMLHGNWLLRGWQLAPVTFYTTELPQYALVEIFLGISPAVVHVSAAITYTLLVLLAGLLAKGNKTGKEGLCRVLIASGIMLAPQIGPGAVLLNIPDHTGTGVPLLLTFLLLDRAPRRAWVPAAVGLMLVWGQIGDRTVVTLGALPIVVVYGMRAYRDVVQRRESVSAHWFDLALIASAALSVGVADGIVKLIAHLGGYKVLPLPAGLAPSADWPAHVAMVVDGVLRLFGASFNNGPVGFATALAVVHLVGVALAVWAFGHVIRQFLAFDDLIAQILVVAILVQVTAYAVSTLPYAGYQDHEIASVLTFGAVLAGRVLAERLTRARLLPALAVVACGYLVALGYGVRQHQVPAHDQALTGWLSAHHLTAGFSTYTVAGAVDLDSHGTILMSALLLHRDYASRGDYFGQPSSDFDPRQHYVNFVVTTKQDGPLFSTAPGWYIHIFGKPAHMYYYQAWTIMTWNKNLLDEVK
ncbi:MAG TPA: hypothetical protein VGI66_01455 [Streptosporangiaceae bacterium]